MLDINFENVNIAASHAHKILSVTFILIVGQH